MSEFMIRAFIAAACVGSVGAVLGCFVMWRRMAYFGDSLSHAALLGVALGLVIGVSSSLVLLCVCVMFGVLLMVLTRRVGLTEDSSLGLLAHSALALGLVMISVFDRGDIDLHSILVGDILTVSWADIWLIGFVSVCVIGVVVFFWSKLLLMSVHRDLAVSQGLRVWRYEFLLVILLGAVVAVAVQVVGVLMVTALLILPAAVARPLARTPESMVLFALLAAVVSAALGLFGSYHFDTPSGPSIVVAALVLFIGVVFGRAIQRGFSA